MVVDVRTRKSRRVARRQGRSDTRSLAGRVFQREIRIQGKPEVQHRKEEHKKERHEESELDEPLPLLPSPDLAPPRDVAPPDHRIGSIRIAFPTLIVIPVPPHKGAPPPIKVIALPTGVTKRYP